MGSLERGINGNNIQRELLPSSENFYPSTVVVASESQRRIVAAKWIFEKAHVISMAGGHERQTPDLTSIANQKVENVLPQAVNLIAQGSQKRGLIIGTDVKIFTLGIEQGMDQYAGVRDQGKPKDPEEVRSNFRDMYKAATMTDDNPYYLIRSTSVIADLNVKRGRNERRSYSPTSVTPIFLETDMIGYLSTPEGFDFYTRESERYFSGQSYLNNGLKMPATLTDITGGIDLPVLVRIGAVKSIGANHEEVGVQDPDFVPHLRNAIFQSAVGFNPDKLRQFHPDVEARIDAWPWLDKVTAYALEKTPSLVS